jgi:hypothetical protein
VDSQRNPVSSQTRAQQQNWPNRDFGNLRITELDNTSLAKGCETVPRQ